MAGKAVGVIGIVEFCIEAAGSCSRIVRVAYRRTANVALTLSEYAVEFIACYARSCLDLKRMKSSIRINNIINANVNSLKLLHDFSMAHIVDLPDQGAYTFIHSLRQYASKSYIEHLIKPVGDDNFRDNE